MIDANEVNNSDESLQSDDDDLDLNKEVKLDDEARASDFWIISSNIYVKRENINIDPSEWKGWEVHARTQKRDIFLILFRRKYLPPMMDNYNEMAFALYGPENFSLT